MKREYIDRESVKKTIKDKPDMTNDEKASLFRRINAIPAADVVRVVRCRECKYWRGENDLCEGICIDFDADGYCSEGKRKDGGQDDA